MKKLATSFFFLSQPIFFKTRIQTHTVITVHTASKKVLQHACFQIPFLTWHPDRQLNPQFWIRINLIGSNNVWLTLVKGGEEYDTPGSVQQYHAKGHRWTDQEEILKKN